MTEPEQPVVAQPLRAAAEDLVAALSSGGDEDVWWAEYHALRAALAVEAVRPLDGGLVGALANMQDFVDHGKATLDAEDVANLKALLALDISLIGAAIKRNLGLAVEAVRPETDIDPERLARALHKAQCEWMCSHDAITAGTDSDGIQHMAPEWWVGEARRVAAAYRGRPE